MTPADPLTLDPAAASGPRPGREPRRGQEARYVSGFVAVISADAREVPLRVPVHPGLPGLVAEHGEGWQVLRFGTPAGPAGGPRRARHPAWIKGRPFPLPGARPLESLGSAEPRELEPFLAGLDGRFSLLLTLPGGAAVCATDLLGSGPLFYAESEGRLYAATHLGFLVATLGSGRPMDRTGIASVAVAWGMVDGVTPWAGIRRLRDGEYLAAAPRGGGGVEWSVRRYAALERVLLDPSPAESGTESLDRFDGILRDALQREALGEGAALMLSGGRDSQAIALCLRRDFGVSLPGVTFGVEGSGDLVRARRLAADLGIPHHAVPYDAWGLETYAPRIAGLNAGSSGLQGSYQLPGYEYAASSGFRTAVVGYLGDATVGTWLPAAGDSNFEDVLGRLYLFRGEPDVCVEAYLPDEVAALVGTLRRLYDRMEGTGMAPHQRMMLCSWLVREACMVSAVFDLAESFLEVSYPFFHRPLLRFSLGLPPSLLRGNRLYEDWLTRAHTALVPGRGRTRWRTAPPRRSWLERLTGREPEVRTDAVVWKDRLLRGEGWLRARVEACCDDPGLRTMCLRSLDRSLRWTGLDAAVRPPTILSVLPAFLARGHCA